MQMRQHIKGRVERPQNTKEDIKCSHQPSGLTFGTFCDILNQEVTIWLNQNITF